MNRGLLIASVALIAVVATAFLLLRPEKIVMDEAGLLDLDELDFISTYHSLLLQDHQIDYRVVTTTENESLLEQSVVLFETLDIGSNSDNGRGLLLLINPAQDQVRLEVSYGLEGAFPDAFVAYIEQRQMVPFFADNRIAEGILATTELIVDRAQRQVTAGGLDPAEVWLAGSGGAGAQTGVQIGTGYQIRSVDGADLTGDSKQLQTPVAVLQAYLEAMAERNGNPSLSIYSRQTQAMMNGRSVTPAQMDSVVRTYRDCPPQAARFNTADELAVIRYAPDQRQCAPWFFIREGMTWKLDLASLGQAIRFGRSNAWRRSESGFGAYEFAFEDWLFDMNGFPRER